MDYSIIHSCVVQAGLVFKWKCGEGEWQEEGFLKGIPPLKTFLLISMVNFYISMVNFYKQGNSN